MSRDKEKNELVFVKGNEVVTDSLIVAEVFNKSHDKVIRDIKVQLSKLNEVGEVEWGVANFGETQYQHPQNKQMYKKYTLTEDAFTLIAMSYVTPEAMKFKVKFIQEFKRMKEYIKKQEGLAQAPLELALEAALKHEREIKSIQSDVNYLKGSMRIDSLQQQEIQETAARSIVQVLGGKESVAYKEISKKVFSAFWKEFKQYFKVPRYGDLPKVKQEEAIRFIQLWRPSTTLQIEIDNCNSQMSFE